MPSRFSIACRWQRSIPRDPQTPDAATFRKAIAERLKARNKQVTFPENKNELEFRSSNPIRSRVILPGGTTIRAMIAGTISIDDQDGRLTMQVRHEVLSGFMLIVTVLVVIQYYVIGYFNRELMLPYGLGWYIPPAALLLYFTGYFFSTRVSFNRLWREALKAAVV